jgi:tRNA(adenine34) deaminase
MNGTDIMRAALDKAREAFAADEIPVGAVISRDGEVIASARNQNREEGDPTLHAEIAVIRKACAIIGNERLTGYDLYVTKEPCAMCAGAIVHARIRKLVIAAPDSRYGACGTVLSVCGNPLLNHVPKIEFGVLADEAAELLLNFFKMRRSEG